MTQEIAADPALGRLAEAILIPPFPGDQEPEWVRAALAGGLAGVTLYGSNVQDRHQLAQLTGRLRSAAIEPVIAIDEEGGDLTRISHQTGSDYPGNAALGAVDDVELTRSVYAALGADLAVLGINLDLAPAVDVNTAADNPVIGTRSFGPDPVLVARHAAAAVAGLQSAGVAACAKHFPGHGSTNLDSHLVLATVDAPLSVLRDRDLPPFEAAIAAGVRAIMPSHLRVPELTGDLPASLSRRAQTDLLRGELGFTGVIVSDGLEMRAVSEPYGIPEAAVQAVIAGTDLLCLGREQDRLSFLAVRAALVDAARSGRLPAERLEEAAARVAELREWTAAAAASPVRADVAVALGLAAARRAVALHGAPPALRRPLIVEFVPPSNLAVGAVPWGLGPFASADSYREVSTATADEDVPALVSGLLAAANDRSLVIVVRDAHRHAMARQAVQLLLAGRPDAVVVEMGLPVWQPEGVSYVASYGAGRSNAQAAAELLGLVAAG
ncbi:MAG TPA: glycoside hydrolase family 3 N-terminal domain-containing protein [Streptosporangiaceae bacterium]|nr:glycoside hydrolase family 3 N-terminal domain-containing protein [Streptosporangiaceae bacterium]